MAWMDNAGLYQKYGVEQTVTSTGGEYKTFGELREIEVKIDLASLTQTETVLNDNIFFPVGMKIEQIEIFCDVAGATGAAIDLGLIKTDRTTEIDYNGFLAAYPVASMTLGAKTVIYPGDTYAGALVGGTTSNVGYITCSATTSTAFTAGSLRVRIKFSRA